MANGHGGSRAGAGRKKGAMTDAKLALIEAAQSHGSTALAVLHEIMSNEKTPPAARVSAANAIMDRGYGRPPQDIDLDAKLDIADPLAELAASIAANGSKIGND